MPGVVNFDIKGAAEMENLLRQLGPKVAAKVGDKALLAGAKHIVQEAKRLVQKKTGRLAKNIASQLKRNWGRVDERVIAIGVRKPVSRIFHLIEFGTSRAAAHPFMRPAMDSQAENALNEMGRVLAKGIEDEAAKLAKG